MQRSWKWCVLSCSRKLGSDQGDESDLSKSAVFKVQLLKGLLRRLLGLNSRASMSIGLGRGPRRCISNKFPVEAVASGTTLWEPLIQTNPMHLVKDSFGVVYVSWFWSGRAKDMSSVGSSKKLSSKKRDGKNSLQPIFIVSGHCSVKGWYLENREANWLKT